MRRPTGCLVNCSDVNGSSDREGAVVLGRKGVKLFLHVMKVLQKDSVGTLPPNHFADFGW